MPTPLPGHIHLLPSHVDLHRWHPKAPHVRQGPDRRQVAGLRLADPALVKLLVLDTHLLELGIEDFRRVELEPTEHNALHQ
jgi:hypothetical protein